MANKNNRKRVAEADSNKKDGDKSSCPRNTVAQQREVNQERTTNARCSLNFHDCLGCDQDQPKTKKSRKVVKTDNAKTKKMMSKATPAKGASNVESDIEEFQTDEESFHETDSSKKVQTNSNETAMISEDEIEKDVEEDESEERGTRTKFTNERSDLDKNQTSASTAENSININELINDEDNEEVLEEVYLKVQKRLAERKKQKTNSNSPKPGTSTAQQNPENGKQTKIFSVSSINREIEKIRKASSARVIDKKAKKNEMNSALVNSNSETTVYTRACRQAPKLAHDFNKTGNQDHTVNKPENKNSDESQVLNSSDELNAIIDEFPTDNFVGEEVDEMAEGPGIQEMQAHMRRLSDHREARDRAEEMVRQAESRKAEIMRPTGRCHLYSHNCSNCGTYGSCGSDTITPNARVVPQRVSNDLSCDHAHYMLSAHVDPATTIKVERGEYVQVERLLPRGERDDNRMDLVNKDGRSYFVPASDRNIPSINNFRQWERAFRIYAGIYSRANPHRSSEIFQYINNIQAAANVYIWENVATYDRVFRRLMHDFPQRNWGLIYQQAWTLELKVQIGQVMGPTRRNSNHYLWASNRTPKETCRRFNNTGKCSYGQACKFDHRCNYCGKFGHGESKCHKKNNAKGGASHSNGKGDKADGKKSPSH